LSNQTSLKIILSSLAIGLLFPSFSKISLAADVDACRHALEMLQFGSIEGEGFKHLLSVSGKDLSEADKAELLKHAGRYLAHLEATESAPAADIVNRTTEAVEHILGKSRLNEGLKIVLPEYQASKKALAGGEKKAPERSLSNVSVELLNSFGEKRQRLIVEFKSLVETFLKMKASFKDPMAEERFIYEVIWDLYERGDQSNAAIELLSRIGHVSTHLDVLNSKIVAGSALLKQQPKNTDAYMSLHAMYRAMLPATDDLARMLGIPAQHDPSMDPLIEIAFDALSFAKKQGNSVAEDIKRTKIEVSDKPDGPFREIKSDDDFEP
jgi:hypothetical protein